ncbi:putative F-box protein At1g49610 [Oryza glaberrima]|uniref:F-box domain-containing protein n=1 Tax=Oryza glaberrima TaxID=4538 RepID=I1Q314_ORYGL|nr:putative F-box protein At1g49610 [Oryza glaberrima]
MADRKKCKAAAVATTDGGGEDRISALPDEVLQRALSFLPSRDVVRTCVLSRRWRHQWKSVPALRIYAFDDCRDVQHLSDFVTNFLLRRNRLALHECDIICFDEGDGCEVFRENARQWIRYAVSCQVRVLRVSVEAHTRLFGAPLKAQRLKRLELFSVELGAFSLDFSSCRELEELELGGCIIKDKVKRILSESLRRLRIEGCDFFRNRTRISCPNLISLEITDFTLYTPVLMSMPSLASAFIRFGEHCADSCDCYYYGEFGPDYTGCHHSTVKGNGTVLLNGLSDAIQLELISGAGVFIFRRDFRCCPTFNKLKTLLLNEWCMAADSSALIYFLQHSPVLEKLTLQLRKSPRTMVKRGSMNKNQNEKFLVSKHLKLVEIKYCEDEMVQQVLHVLSACGIPSEKIIIQRISSWASGGFSFEQRK